jgi:hypothetical protein
MKKDGDKINREKTSNSLIINKLEKGFNFYSSFRQLIDLLITRIYFIYSSLI